MDLLYPFAPRTTANNINLNRMQMLVFILLYYYYKAYHYHHNYYYDDYDCHIHTCAQRSTGWRYFFSSYKIYIKEKESDKICTHTNRINCKKYQDDR